MVSGVYKVGGVGLGMVEGEGGGGGGGLGGGGGGGGGGRGWGADVAYYLVLEPPCWPNLNQKLRPFQHAFYDYFANSYLRRWPT